MDNRRSSRLGTVLDPMGRAAQSLGRWIPDRFRDSTPAGLPRAFWLFFAVFAVGMVLISLVGDQGLIAYWRLNREARELRHTVEGLQTRRYELHRSIRALHEDLDYIEQLARRNLGLVRPGEVVLQMPPGPPVGRRGEP